jgi:membrane protease YdiL (CAAX protease family)
MLKMEKTLVRATASAHEPSIQVNTRRAGVFYLLAYAISWLSWILLIAFFQSDRQPRILWKVGQFGPFLAIGMACLHVALYLLSGGEVELASDPPWYSAVLFFPIVVLINAPFGSGIGEETGWQGFAMPRLVTRLHPLLACTIHGVLWAAWHLPAFLASWMGEQPLGWFFAYVIPLSMIAFWLTCKAKGSAIPAILLHSSSNLYSTYLLSDRIFSNTLAANFTEIKTVIYWAIAIVLIVTTKGRLGYRASSPAAGHPKTEGTAVV